MPASNTRKTASKPKTGARKPKAAPPVEQHDSFNPDMPGNDKYAVTGWGGGTHEDLRLPSGQLCLARKVGTEGLLKAGIIHDLDPFQGLVEQHKKRMAGNGSEIDNTKLMQAILSDKTKMTSMFHMLDRVLCYVVVKPQVEMTPNDPTRRENGKVYADTVDLQDKVYIMGWAIGKVDEMASFREGLTEPVVSVLPGEVDGSTSL